MKNSKNKIMLNGTHKGILFALAHVNNLKSIMSFHYTQFPFDWHVLICIRYQWVQWSGCNERLWWTGKLYQLIWIVHLPVYGRIQKVDRKRDIMWRYVQMELDDIPPLSSDFTKWNQHPSSIATSDSKSNQTTIQSYKFKVKVKEPLFFDLHSFPMLVHLDKNNPINEG